ncbi:MAG: hypothetical protein WAK17_04075 [Candidatus Nitrosopolaris sp.]
MSGEVVMVYPTIISLLAIFNVRYEMNLSQVKNLSIMYFQTIIPAKAMIMRIVLLCLEMLTIVDH